MSKILNALEKKFPDCWFKPGEEFDGGSAAVWSGEGSEIDGIPAFDYWAEDYKERVYVMGVNRKLVEFVTKKGYYWECYDPGTYMLYKI